MIAIILFQLAIGRPAIRSFVGTPSTQLQLRQMLRARCLKNSSHKSKGQDFSHCGADEKSLLDEALRRGREPVAV